MSTVRKILLLITMIPLIVAGGMATFTVPRVLLLRFSVPFRTATMWQKPGPVVQKWIPLSEMPSSLRHAVVAAEDANFFSHYGVDFREMEASFEKNSRGKRYARGFSTITMQLARNLYLTPYKSVVRKAAEIFITMEMEFLLPKDRILELYLNLIEWGKGIYGAEAAARHYFKKSVRALTPSESAFLAAIIPSPVRWGHWPPGPYIQRRMRQLHPEK